MQVFELHHIKYTTLTFFILVCIKNNFGGTHRIICMSKDMFGVFYLFISINCYPASYEGEQKLQGELQSVSCLLEDSNV